MKARLKIEADGSVAYANFDGKKVATYDPSTRTLSKRVFGGRSFKRLPPAITFDDFIVDNAVARGAETIEVLDEDDGTLYRIPAAEFVAERFKTAVDKDRGYPQSHVVMTRWERLDATGRRLTP